jgi:hypothetical protein
LRLRHRLLGRAARPEAVDARAMAAHVSPRTTKLYD